MRTPAAIIHSRLLYDGDSMFTSLIGSTPMPAISVFTQESSNPVRWPAHAPCKGMQL